MQLQDYGTIQCILCVYNILSPRQVNYMSVHADTGLEVYTCVDKEVVMFKNGAQVSCTKVAYEPNGCAISPSGTVLVVGAKSVSRIH